MDNWFLEELRLRKHERLAILGLVVLILISFLLRFVPVKYNRPDSISKSDILKIKNHKSIHADKVVKQGAPNDGYQLEDVYSNKFKKDSKGNSKGRSRLNAKDKNSKYKAFSNREVFTFNPNSVSQDSLELLGFKSYIAERWVKFRKKGKKFYSLSDVKSIYGIDTALVESLENQYKFPTKPSNKYKQVKKDQATRKEYANSNDLKNESDLAAQFSEVKQKPKYIGKKEPPLASIDLNSADEDELMKIPGIGVSYSNRITKYRSMLGGFHNKNQIKSVYGMSDSLYQIISKYFILDSEPNKIPINIVSEKELASHYLLTYKEAKIISAYKGQHGPFTGPQDFLKLLALSNEKKESLIPYLDFRI